MTILSDTTMVMTSAEWEKKGVLISVFDKKIFTIDTGNHKKCLLILHGYLTSSYDYHKVLPELSKHYRVILMDFIGFGFSEKLNKKYFTIIDQTDYVLELCSVLGLNSITLFAHDYGTEIAQEIIARKNYSLTDITIEKYIFCNGNMPLDHSFFLDYHKVLKEQVAKKLIAMLASFGVYKKTIKEVSFDEHKISDDELKEMWYQLELNKGRDIINFVHHYIRERKIFWHRWVQAIKENKVPVKLIRGRQDPINAENIADPFATKNDQIDELEILWIENCGHYPMLESPKEWIAAVLKS
jgi:pimeloyl-ACP methyl ester carboxylesterase